MSTAPERPRTDPLERLRPHPRSFGDPIVRSWRLAVAGLLLAVAASLLVRDNGGLLALGLLLGVLAASGFALLLAMLRPIGALLIAARPLGIPLLLILAAGTIDSPVVLQLIAGTIAMLVALTLLVRPEWPQVLRALERAIEPAATPAARTRRRRWIAAGTVALVLILLAALVLPPGGSLEARGGLAAYLFALTVVLLGVCALLRLLGYSRSIVRLPVAVLMVLAGVRLAMSAGVLPGDEAFSGVSTTLLVALAGAGLVLAVAVDTWSWVRAQRASDLEDLERAVALERPVHPAGDHRRRVRPRAARRRRRLGGAAGRDGALGEPRPGDGRDRRLARDRGARGAARCPGVDGRRGARARLRAAAAVLEGVAVVSDPGRRLRGPRRGHAESRRLGEAARRPVQARHAHRLPDDRPGAVLHDLDGLHRRRRPMRAARARPGGRERSDGAVYVRVIHKGAPRPDRSPNAFDRLGPYGAATTTIVQYWFFYAFDDWISPVIAGQLRQYHQADWESLTIGFSDTRPLFVGFSQHCGGEWYPWNRVRVTDRTRTVVAVAEGSQANYRFPNPSQAPDWTGCANLPARTTTLVSYASNIRDRTRADWSWSPPADGFEFVDARDFPMNIVARWAPYSRTELQTLHRDHRLGSDASGPATPSVQALWREPMRTIFAGPHWHRGKE